MRTNPNALSRLQIERQNIATPRSQIDMKKRPLFSGKVLFAVARLQQIMHGSRQAVLCASYSVMCCGLVDSGLIRPDVQLKHVSVFLNFPFLDCGRIPFRFLVFGTYKCKVRAVQVRLMSALCHTRLRSST